MPVLDKEEEAIPSVAHLFSLHHMAWPWWWPLVTFSIPFLPSSRSVCGIIHKDPCLTVEASSFVRALGVCSTTIAVALASLI